MREFERIGWKPSDRILLYGIGNVGRQDDGLGVRLIERLESAGVRVRLEANYQLNIEDALLLSEFDVVVFADATVEEGAKAPFSVRPIESSSEVAFSTHAMSIGSVISLSEELYGKRPRAFLLALPGYGWDIVDQMTEPAKRNLDSAFQALLEALPCTKSR